MINDQRIFVVDDVSTLVRILCIFIRNGCLLGGFAINHYFLGSSVIITLFICILFLVATWSDKYVKQMSSEEAYAYLKAKLHHDEKEGKR